MPRIPRLALALLVILPLAARAEDPPRSIFDFGNKPATRPTATTRPASATAPTAATDDAPRPILATFLVLVADDFVTDIHHNGKRIPDAQRKLIAEVYGAQVERVTVNLRAGDWLVFNVVNNRLRWNGAYFFAAAALNPDRVVVFPSETRTGDWSACDDLEQVPRFIADRDHGRDNKPEPVRKPWDQGKSRMLQICPDFNGEPIWGDPRSKSTWLKFVVPADAPTPGTKGL